MTPAERADTSSSTADIRTVLLPSHSAAAASGKPVLRSLAALSRCAAAAECYLLEKCSSRSAVIVHEGFATLGNLSVIMQNPCCNRQYRLCPATNITTQPPKQLRVPLCPQHLLLYSCRSYQLLHPSLPAGKAA